MFLQEHPDPPQSGFFIFRTMTMKEEIIVASAKAAPPTVVAGLTFFGVGLNDVVMLVTLLYLFLQIGVIIKNQIKERKNKCDSTQK